MIHLLYVPHSHFILSPTRAWAESDGIFALTARAVHADVY